MGNPNLKYAQIENANDKGITYTESFTDKLCVYPIREKLWFHYFLYIIELMSDAPLGYAYLAPL
jgi:hypothetical protein